MGRATRPRGTARCVPTIDWSYDLLDAGEQRLFVQLSVFSGGFTLESLLEVADSGDAVAQLGALVEASVVQAGAGRHRLLEVVREYAAERLAGDAEPKIRHARYFTALAEAAEQGLSGRDQGEWLVRLDAEHDNLRAALDWLAAGEDRAGELRLAVALARFWYVRGHVGEGLARLLHALERAPASAGTVVAKALRSASALALIQGDYALARDLVERALALYRSLGDPLGAARSLSNLGAILHAQGELELAASTLDGCLGDCAELDDARLVALARNNRGDVGALTARLRHCGGALRGESRHPARPRRHVEHRPRAVQPRRGGGRAGAGRDRPRSCSARASRSRTSSATTRTSPGA